MATITEVNVAQNLTALWGINAYEYSISGKQVDFQDLMVAVSEKRAVSVEGEVQPLTTRVRTRNKELEILGSLLAKFTQTQSSYDSNATGSTMKPVRGITEEEIPLASEAYRRKGGSPGSNLDWWNSDWSKASVEGMISMLKTMIDSRNNESQTDMSRLQSLVDRRDESYSTATNLMHPQPLVQSALRARSKRLRRVRRLAPLAVQSRTAAFDPKLHPPTRPHNQPERHRRRLRTPAKRASNAGEARFQRRRRRHRTQP